MPRAPRIAATPAAPPPLVDGQVQSARCPKGCGDYLVFTPDAIGRMRERCPTCDGVNRRPSSLAPDLLRVTPQELVPVARVGTYTLPPVTAGQLRCQRCARGVVGLHRFCVDCSTAQSAVAKPPKPAPALVPVARVTRPLPESVKKPRNYAPKPCRCGKTFQPTGPRHTIGPCCRSEAGV